MEHERLPSSPGIVYCHEWDEHYVEKSLTLKKKIGRIHDNVEKRSSKGQWSFRDFCTGKPPLPFCSCPEKAGNIHTYVIDNCHCDREVEMGTEKLFNFRFGR